MAAEPKSTSSRVLVRTYADRVILAKFRAQFPMHGSLSWVLEAAMTEILAITDGQPELDQVVRQSIRSTLLRNKLAGRIAADEQSNDGPVAAYPISVTPVGADR